MTPEPAAEVMVAAVGDVMLARSVGRRVLAEDAAIVFAEVTADLDKADVVVGNLESPISARGAPVAKGYTFRAPPEATDALLGASFDILSLANNHALDFGPEALADTIELLEGAGIAPVGAGNDREAAYAPKLLDVRGLRLAFLAFVDVPIESGGFDPRTWEASEATPGVAWADAAAISKAVSAASRAADVVVVMFHFGLEGRTEPAAEQRTFARMAVDAGATLVIGSHPHVLQEVEEYRGSLIAYSLGNFVFDGFEGLATDSAILLVRLSAGGLGTWELVPVQVVKGLPTVTR